MKVSAVRLNETIYFFPAKEDKPYIKAFYSVYAFAPETCVHLCELTPSYELRYLYSYIEGTEKMTDDMRDYLDEKYCHQDIDDIYRHCRVVDKLNTKECGEFETMEDAVEYLQGNWPL